MKELKRTTELETFYDLVANLGADIGSSRIDLHRVGPDGTCLEDPQARMDVLLYWTDEFNRLHAKTDWSEVDYIETVDDFYAAKIEPFVKEKQIVGYGFDTDTFEDHGERISIGTPSPASFWPTLPTSATDAIVQRARNHYVLHRLKTTRPAKYVTANVAYCSCRKDIAAAIKTKTAFLLSAVSSVIHQCRW